MGGNTSKSSVQVVNEFFNKQTSEFIVNNSQTVDATGILSQNIEFGSIKSKGCRIDFSQTIDASVSSTGQMSEANIQDLTTHLKNAASSEIDNAASQKNGFLTTAIANSSEARTNLKNKVTNIIENTMSSTSVQNIFAKMNATQTAKYNDMDVECDPAYRNRGEFDFVASQHIKAQIVAKGVADKLTSALSTTIAENTVDNKVKQTASLQNLGLESMQAGIISSVVGCVICLLIMVGAFVLLGQSDAGQNVIRAKGGA
jgi:hypothetical protein